MLECFSTPCRAWQEVGDGLPGMALAVNQGGRQSVVAAVGGGLDKARREGLPEGGGLMWLGRLAGRDDGGAAGVVAWNQVADEVAGTGSQAEDGMQARSRARPQPPRSEKTTP